MEYGNGLQIKDANQELSEFQKMQQVWAETSRDWYHAWNQCVETCYQRDMANKAYVEAQQALYAVTEVMERVFSEMNNFKIDIGNDAPKVRG